MQITLGVQVDAPIARVFEVFTDLSNAQDRLTNVATLEVLTPGPVGVGTRWRETRRMMGQDATEELSVTGYEPPERFEAVAASHGARYRTHYRFSPDGAGTRVAMTFSAEAVTLLARLMSVTGVIFKSATEKALLTDLEDLKRACEAED